MVRVCQCDGLAMLHKFALMFWCEGCDTCASQQEAVEIFDTINQQLIMMFSVWSQMSKLHEKHSTKQMFVMLHQISLNNNMLIYLDVASAHIFNIIFPCFWAKFGLNVLNVSRASIMIECFDSCISMEFSSMNLLRSLVHCHTCMRIFWVVCPFSCLFFENIFLHNSYCYKNVFLRSKPIVGE